MRKSEADNIDQVLDNSGYHLKAKFNNCFT